MQAAPAVSSSATPAFDVNNAGNNVSTSVIAAQQQRRQHRYSHRSTSLSSGSVRTALRPESPSESPAEDSAWAQSRARRDPMSLEHKRRKSVAVDPSDYRGNDLIGIGAIDRWSQSTTSSATSNTRRNRSSSGAVFSSWSEHALSPRQKPLKVADASPRATTQRRHVSSGQPLSLSGSPEQSRRFSIAERGRSGTHTESVSLDNDQERPTTSSTAHSSHSSRAQNGYFDGDEVSMPNGITKAKRVVVVRNQTAPMEVPRHRSSGSKSHETIKGVARPASQGDHGRRGSKTNSSEGSGHHKRARTRERTEKDKKAMLSKALQKANTAVLLDNAQNYEGALEAYGDACDLLTQVMELTSGEDDKRKLDAIRVTYTNRIAELRLLLQVKPTAAEEKNLPARPMSSDESMDTRSPENATFGAGDDTVSAEESDTATADSAKDIPRLSYARNDRDSFFERTMQAVESSYTEAQDASRVDESTVAGAPDDRTDVQPLEQPTAVHLPPPEQHQYMPRPLSPRRPSSPKTQPQADDDEHAKVQDRDIFLNRMDSKDSTSWLDTIDETGSSCSDSVHSVDDLQGVHRKHIRGTSGGTDPDFDAAFDAAVEAAYDEGFEPDLEARRKRLTALKLRHAQDQEQAPGEPDLDPDAEEEERILDDFTQDYAQGFNFDLQSKSALPRESDSSGYSRSTWQSSQQSDRATAATSLSAVAEDGLVRTQSKNAANAASATRVRGESIALPPPSAPPTSALPRPPSTSNNRQSGVRSRRLSGMNPKQLKIETSPQAPEVRKRASTFHHTTSPFPEDDEDRSTLRKQEKFGESLEPTPSDAQHDNILKSPPSLEFQSSLDDTAGLAVKTPIETYRPSYEEVPGDLPSGRPALFRKNKSALSLREHGEHTLLLHSPDADSGQSLMTPMSSTFASFAAKRNQNPLTSQRANLPSVVQGQPEHQTGGGIYLFDTSLSTSQTPNAPRSPPLSPHPVQLEPCPESFLLRPFWLMRQISQTITHPRGGFLSNKLFVPREVWQTRGVKLRLVEDKVANCDLLTAALGRLGSVDTYDADAVMDELQSFEEVMERVQAVLTKRLGSDVGVHGAASMFKDASFATAAGTTATGSDTATLSEKAAKSTSGKSYLTTWRKLRNKSSGAPLSSGMSSQSATKSGAEKEQHTMQSVPMTSFVPVERRGNKREARNMSFDGPNKEYMGSLARLFDGVQILDQIARQVEDPGLKHSSPTHVGLELSIRHAAEFFGFYVCRFVLADLGVLVDKFVKRGTEWVLA